MKRNWQKNIVVGVWLFLSGLSTPAFGDLSQDLLGLWQYDGFYYQDHRFAPPNPDLILLFEFASDGRQEMRYRRGNDGTFCDRKGPYLVHQDWLSADVDWLNPDNSRSCSGDPDMQIGHHTDNQISIQDGELAIHMDLNGQAFLYLMRKVSSPSQPHILSRKN